MDPSMMRMAMEQMKNMTPEQMAEMSRMAASMGPAQMAEAQRMMGGMSPSQMAEMQQAASGIRGGLGMPASVAPAARPLQPDLSAASAAVKTAAELKEAGNKLHQAGKHDAAIGKYQRALDSLAGDSSPAGKAVAKACSLNLGACTLKLGRNEECVEHCTRVLDEDGSNHKALYRRGQALLGKGDAAAAVADLQKAVRLAPAGDRPIMQPALDRARQQLPAGTTQEGDVTIEEITDASVPAPPAPQQPQMQMPAGLGDPAEAARYAQMMRDNPALAKMSENMLQGMSQEQLDAIAKSVGRPPIRKEEAMQAMRNMTPDQFEALAQQEFTAGQAPTAEQLSRTAAQLKDNPAMLQRSLDMMRGMSQQQLEAAARAAGLPDAAITPDHVAELQRQTASMSPEQRSQLASHAAAAHAANAGSPLPAQPSAAAQQQPASQAQAAPSSAAAPASSPSQPLPGGGMFTPEMMQAASSMMSSMTPEDMAAMTGFLGAAGGPSMGADGVPQISPELMAKMQTPEMMRSMQGMMRSMPADQLAAMMSQQGMKVSPQQAEQMKTQMDNLSERQMWWLMTCATATQRALAAAQRARAYLAANPAITGAIALAVVLVLLRWLGYL